MIVKRVIAEHHDSRYQSPDFAKGVTFAGKTRYALTTQGQKEAFGLRCGTGQKENPRGNLSLSDLTRLEGSTSFRQMALMPA